jgi:hypothetical protein
MMMLAGIKSWKNQSLFSKSALSGQVAIWQPLPIDEKGRSLAFTREFRKGKEE